MAWWRFRSATTTRRGLRSSTVEIDIGRWRVAAPCRRIWIDPTPSSIPSLPSWHRLSLLATSLYTARGSLWNWGDLSMLPLPEVRRALPRPTTSTSCRYGTGKLMLRDRLRVRLRRWRVVRQQRLFLFELMLRLLSDGGQTLADVLSGERLPGQLVLLPVSV